jgi:GT2 family glycosyltransferase
MEESMIDQIKIIPEICSVTTLRKAITHLKQHGVVSLLYKVREKLDRQYLYNKWINENEPTLEELAIQREEIFIAMPKISVIVPIYDTPRSVLHATIQSVLEQTYSNWELCLVDGFSKASHIRGMLEQYADEDDRILVRFLNCNKGIVGNSNEALSIATGEFVALLDHDDLLSPFALYEIVRAINKNPDVDFIYSDEDKISENGDLRFDPHFKPSWSPDMLRSYNYITHLAAMRKTVVERVGGFRDGFDGSQDYDLFLRITEETKRIVHIPKILYHWRAIRTSVAGEPGAKSYAYEAAKRALESHLEREGIDGVVDYGESLGSYRINYKLASFPRISIVVPAEDYTGELSRCLESLLRITGYADYEVLIVTNSISEKQIRGINTLLECYDKLYVITSGTHLSYPALCNLGARSSSGDVLLFLDSDIEVIGADWLSNMVQHTTRKENGAIGAKLLYLNRRVYHAGIILGLNGVTGHSHKLCSSRSKGYMQRLEIVQNVSAVSGSCMMMRKSVLEDVGGFCEEFSMAYADVDLCMRIREKGYLIIFTPYSQMYCRSPGVCGYEDARDKTMKYAKDIALFKERWAEELAAGDPYYNPNLTLEDSDFSIKVKCRK